MANFDTHPEKDQFRPVLAPQEFRRQTQIPQVVIQKSKIYLPIFPYCRITRIPFETKVTKLPERQIVLTFFIWVDLYVKMKISIKSSNLCFTDFKSLKKILTKVRIFLKSCKFFITPNTCMYIVHAAYEKILFFLKE